MLPLQLLLVPLLASCSTANYYFIFEDGFNDYIGDSSFHVTKYEDISLYGIPPPPGGLHTSAVYLTDVSPLVETPVTVLPARGVVHFRYDYLCDHEGSELEIRFRYPVHDEHIYLCGPNANASIQHPNTWITESAIIECEPNTNCTHMELWLYGETNKPFNIVGLWLLTISTDYGTTTSTTTTSTTTMTTTTEPPGCDFPGSSCAFNNGICRPSCHSNEYPSTEDTCGGANCQCCKMHWPGGKYGMVQSIDGCPTPEIDNEIFSEGWVLQDTESHNRNDSHYLAGYVLEHQIRKDFCMKSGGGGIGDWPKGDYCLFQKGGQCPAGFESGTAFWEDRDLNYDNTWEGSLPDGIFRTSDTKLQYCCRNDSSYSTAIKLPTEDPFVLMRNSQEECQEVAGMTSVKQFLGYDTEDWGDDSYLRGDYPYIWIETDGYVTDGDRDSAHNIAVHYCYYYNNEVINNY